MKCRFPKTGVLVLGGFLACAMFPSVGTAGRGDGDRKTEPDKAPNPEKKARDYWASLPALPGHAFGADLKTSQIEVGCRAGERNMGADRTGWVKIEAVYSADGKTASGAWQGPSSTVCHMGPQATPTKTCPFQLEKSGYWLIRCRIEPQAGEVETNPADNIRTLQVRRINVR